MKKNILLLISLFLYIHTASAQEYVPTSSGQIIKHTFYSISYSEANEQAEWVYYKLTPDMTNTAIPRSDNFRPDPFVATGSADLSDYKGSGYDRGHLAPAADMKISALAMSESFFLSNMSPQLPAFNRGGWKNLESLVRNWAASEGLIYVVTGPVFKHNKGSIGTNQVTIPGYYYKVIYAPESAQMIGLVMPNQKITKPLSAYTIAVDSIEALTNIDFFPQLIDSIEYLLESNTDFSHFTFNNTGSNYQNKPSESVATQCLGIAKSTGQRCKSKTTNANGYCNAHQNQAPDYVKSKSTGYVGRCTAITKAGTQCKRQATGGTRYCWQHQK
jgi:endonuclease G